MGLTVQYLLTTAGGFTALARDEMTENLQYLRVIPLSPTSVWSPAAKSSRSRFRAHCSITIHSLSIKRSENYYNDTFLIAMLIEWRAEEDVILQKEINAYAGNTLLGHTPRTLIVSFCTQDSCAA